MLALLAQPGLIVGRAPAPCMTAATASQLEANRLASSTASYLDSTVGTNALADADGVVTPTELSGAELPLADGTVTAGSWIESRQAALKAAALKNEGAAAIEHREERQQGLKVATLKLDGAAAIAQRATTQQAYDVAALKAEGFAWIAERAARQQGLRVATLKTEGAAAIEERDARQAGLKAATLKMEGAAAIEQRTTTQQGLKVAMLKTEGQNVINMREVRQAQLEEKAAAADLGDAPDGFTWGGVY